MQNWLPRPLFSFQGTVGQWQFFMVMVAIFTLSCAYLFGMQLILSGESMTSGVGRGIYLFWILALTPFGFSLTVRRLRDLNMSLWWILALWVPFLNLYVWIVMLFKKGNSQPIVA